MNIEEVRDYCLSLPMVTEDLAFGDEHLLFRIMNKIFACVSFELQDYVTMKCDPELAVEIRDLYTEIKPAWHWNKKYWNQVNIRGNLSQDFIKSLIRHSYSEVVKKLPKKYSLEFPEITSISK